MPGLVELLSRETGLVREFIASLDGEQEALRKGETEPLVAIGRRKNELVEQLNAAEGERNAFLQQAGYPGDRDGMAAWLEKNRGDRSAADHWNKLLELAGQARQINDLNGRLIAMRLQATSQALASLTQQSQRTSLYGRDGLTAPRTGSRIIDAA